MLNENMKAIRKSKGLSQQELAIKLNVVRQTVSKWEQGLSVPDSDMLISISEVLETPVSTLLGETVIETEVDNLKAISEKLEVINLQLAQRKTTKRKIVCWLLISLCAIIILIFAALIIMNSPYLGWDYSDPEAAVLGVAFHSFEWLFVRVAPIILIAAIIGIFFTCQLNELINRSVSKMKKKVIGIITAIVIVLGLSLVAYNQITPDEYVPAADEIALHIQLDTEEDVGLLVYDYRTNSHKYSGGISNADKSLIKHDSDNIVVWNKEELNNLSDTFELLMQFRIITEYVAPNYENVYPDDITKHIEPISWEAHFGETYFITITGGKTNGYKAVLN